MAAMTGPVKNPELGPYFKVPKGLIVNGIAGRIGASAVAVYIALCERANRKCGNVFSVSDKALAADTGVAERTIREVRTKLSGANLISVERAPGQSYTYKLLPVKSEWRPLKDRPRQPKKCRANESKWTATPAKIAAPPPADIATPVRQCLQNCPAEFANPSVGFQKGRSLEDYSPFAAVPYSNA